jgi:hypothetical protein
MVAADETGGDRAGIDKQVGATLHHKEEESMSRNVGVIGLGAMGPGIVLDTAKKAAFPLPLPLTATAQVADIRRRYPAG